MKTLISLLITLFCFSELLATGQYPDKIIYNDKEYSLLTNPLEKFFNENEDKFPSGGVMSSALWRGYLATFEIVENQLYVKDIQIQMERNDGYEWKSVINEVFPEISERKLVWFSGLLTLPYGEIINYVHMGYGSTYENYSLIEIANGKSINVKSFNYKEYENFKNKQFEIYKKSTEYKTRKNDLKGEGWKEKDIDKFLKSFVIQYTEKLLI